MVKNEKKVFYFLLNMAKKKIGVNVFFRLVTIQKDQKKRNRHNILTLRKKWGRFFLQLMMVILKK